MRTSLALIIVTLLAVTTTNPGTVNPKPWAVYYSDKEPVEAFQEYDLLVFDSHHHPRLGSLLDRGKTVLGYISLGEVEERRAFFPEVRRQGILLGENPNWPGSHYVDVRDARWTSRVIEQIIPEILRQGFDGLFMDTLDDPPHLERTRPRRFFGMTEAASVLVRTIRRHYPEIQIMMNRGYELLPGVESHIDMLLAESLYADYDFQKKVYRRVPDDLYQSQLQILNSARERKPGLRILSLDYWSPGDRKEIARIYQLQRRNGFEPYVGTVELDLLVREPRQ